MTIAGNGIKEIKLMIEDFKEGNTDLTIEDIEFEVYKSYYDENINSNEYDEIAKILNAF